MAIKNACRLLWIGLSACFLGCGGGGVEATTANDEAAADETVRTCPLKKGARFTYAQHTPQFTVDCHYGDGSLESYGPSCDTDGDDWVTIAEGDVGFWVECRESRESCTFTCSAPTES